MSTEEKLYDFADQVRKEGEGAKHAMSEGISKAKSKMAGKTFGPPQVPATPSKSINQMLESRCSKTFDNPAKAAVAYYICFVFTAITKLYHVIYTDKSKSSHTMWMVACGVVATAVLLKTLILYSIIIGCSFIAHYLLFYGAILLALFGIGLAVSGIVFFDKEAPAILTGGGNVTSSSFAKKAASAFDSKSD